MRARGTPYLLQVLGLALTYIVGARLGQFTAIAPGNVSALWAPSGIAVAAIALFGTRVWPGIWLGSFAYNFGFFHGGIAIDPSAAMGVAIGIATGSTLMAVAGRYAVQLIQGPVPTVDSPRDALLWTLVAGFLAALISATVGTTMLSLGGILPLAAPVVWRTWWLGDATGVVLIAPVVILWAQHGVLRFRAGQETETLAASAAFGVICFLVFGTTAPRTSAPYLLAVPVLFLSYTALRFGRRITATTALVLAVVAGVATASGRGPLHATEYPEALVELQAFLAFGATLSLTLAGAVVQSRPAASEPAPALPAETGAFPIAELVSFRRTAPAVPASPAAPDPATSIAAPPPTAPAAPTTDSDLILGALPEPVYVLTRGTLAVSRCNLAFAQALGFADRAAVEGRSLFDLFPPAVALAAADESRRVFHTGEARETRERWAGTDPASPEFEVSRTPLRDAEGGVEALLARAHRVLG
ncbi:MAG TPA: MASE1 domain-containing protein [Gemmatimonadales bacterium]|nr:MASE1 domain-containing protein [Gemmatimonadales bacterium]